MAETKPKAAPAAKKPKADKAKDTKKLSKAGKIALDIIENQDADVAAIVAKLGDDKQTKAEVVITLNSYVANANQLVALQEGTVIANVKQLKRACSQIMTSANSKDAFVTASTAKHFMAIAKFCMDCKDAILANDTGADDVKFSFSVKSYQEIAQALGEVHLPGGFHTANAINTVSTALVGLHAVGEAFLEGVRAVASKSMMFEPQPEPIAIDASEKVSPAVEA